MPSTGMIVIHYDCILCTTFALMFMLFYYMYQHKWCVWEMYLYVCILICPSVELKVKLMLECHCEHRPGLHVYFTAITSTKLQCLEAVDCLEHRRGASTPIGHLAVLKQVRQSYLLAYQFELKNCRYDWRTSTWSKSLYWWLVCFL